jgi:hypothetical protein
MRFEIRFTLPVFIKDEQSRVCPGLVQIVIDTACFGARRTYQAFQSLAKARFLARFRANVRNTVTTPSMSVSLWVNILALNQFENVAVHYEGEDA